MAILEVGMDAYLSGRRLLQWSIMHFFIAWLIGLFFNFGKIWKEWRVTRAYLRDAFPADLKSRARFSRGL